MPAAEPFTDDEIDALFAPIAGEAHIALGVSGGSDSAALMHLVHRWTRQRHRHPGEGRNDGLGEVSPRLTVLTVDHGLRTESAAEARVVGAWAEALGLDHVILNWEGPKPVTGLQAHAREARYRLMGDWCRKHGIKVLLIAHTIEDQAETVLMRLKRGAGVEGLGGMAALAQHGDVATFRPLLAVSRHRLRSFLTATGGRWLDDPSNEDERFERVRMRKTLVEAGLEAQAVALTARRSRRVFEAILAVATKFLDAEVRQHPEGYGELSLEAFLAAPQEIRIRALWSLVTRYGDRSFVELSQAENLSDWIDRSGGQAHTLGGCRIVCRTNSLVFGREPGRISRDPVPVPASGRLRWDRRFDIEAREPHSGMAIVPAGAAGTIARRADLPAFVQASLPAILVEGRLAAVPSLKIGTPSALPELAVTATFWLDRWF